MVAHVEVHRIQHTVITFCFLVAVGEKMFLDPACPERVQANGKKEAG
jgi:hypothetical protein